MTNVQIMRLDPSSTGSERRSVVMRPATSPFTLTRLSQRRSQQQVLGCAKQKLSCVNSKASRSEVKPLAHKSVFRDLEKCPSPCVSRIGLGRYVRWGRLAQWLDSQRRAER